MKLEQAFSIQRGEVVSFIGAGGKTSALFRLGQELMAHGWRVVATTTTRIAESELRNAPYALTVGAAASDAKRIAEALNNYGFVFVYDRIQQGKVLGIRPEVVRMLLDRVNGDVLLVEADGARRLPFKAPYHHEPVIPPETTRVVLVAGMDALGKPLDSEHVYNPGAMIDRYGYPAGEVIVWPWLASVLRDEQLGLRNVDAQTPVTVLLNKTPPEGIIRRRAQLIASLLLRSPRIAAVAIGAVRDPNQPIHEVRRPVVAIVLAAGLSSRMGKVKVLLPWGRETVLEAILRRLHMARLDQIVVVTGHEAERIRPIATRFSVTTVHNPDYRRGEMLSSLQAGLRALDDRFAGCLVVLGDQPQIQGRVVGDLLTAFAEGRGSIVAPSFQMRRGHPILIGCQHWPALLDLPAGSAPRDVINARAGEIAYVEVSNDSILQDIDTPKDYGSARRRAGLV